MEKRKNNNKRIGRNNNNFAYTIKITYQNHVIFDIQNFLLLAYRVRYIEEIRSTEHRLCTELLFLNREFGTSRFDCIGKVRWWLCGRLLCLQNTKGDKSHHLLLLLLNMFFYFFLISFNIFHLQHEDIIKYLILYHDYSML